METKTLRSTNYASWNIEIIEDKTSQVNPFVKVSSNYLSEYPVLWPNGIAAWDFPERIPDRVKAIATKYLKSFHTLKNGVWIRK